MLKRGRSPAGERGPRPRLIVAGDLARKRRDRRRGDSAMGKELGIGGRAREMESGSEGEMEEVKEE
jgi:hypothetical protein